MGGHRAGTVYTYRAYSAIAFGVAAGEIDLRYAMALPEILRDREQFTSMQRGLSSFIAPHGLPMVYVRARGRPGRFVERCSCAAGGASTCSPWSIPSSR